MSARDSERFDQGMRALNRVGLGERRQALLALAQGRVLEIGAGAGSNGAHYPAAAHVVATDINPEHLQLTRRKGHLTRLACADAQQLPFPDDSFDVVCATLVFCSIPDPMQALGEVKRVLRPQGRLLLLEHVRGQGAISRRLTDWLNPLWLGLQGECHLNRETARTVAAAGFRLDQVDQAGWWGVLAEIHATKVI